MIPEKKEMIETTIKDLERAGVLLGGAESDNYRLTLERYSVPYLLRILLHAHELREIAMKAGFAVPA
ncbi:hypothetical protein ES705_46915 [subsurface metagenome]